jgi:hypothetical protein
MSALGLALCGVFASLPAEAAEYPDVRVSVGAPSQVSRGSSFAVTITVENLGLVPAHRVATNFFLGAYPRPRKQPLKGQVRLLGASGGAYQAGTFVHWSDPTVAPLTSISHTVTLEVSPHARLKSVAGEAILTSYEPQDSDEYDDVEQMHVGVVG